MSGTSPKLDATLGGSGLLFMFAYVDASATSVGDPPLQLEFRVRKMVAVHIDASQAFVREGTGPVHRVGR